MYIIYKVQNDNDNITIEIETIVNYLEEARNYIEHLEYFQYNTQKCIITKRTDSIPTDLDDDGYYLIKNPTIENRVDIYKKKQIL